MAVMWEAPTVNIIEVRVEGWARVKRVRLSIPKTNTDTALVPVYLGGRLTPVPPYVGL